MSEWVSEWLWRAEQRSHVEAGEKEFNSRLLLCISLDRLCYYKYIIIFSIKIEMRRKKSKLNKRGKGNALAQATAQRVEELMAGPLKPHNATHSVQLCCLTLAQYEGIPSPTDRFKTCYYALALQPQRYGDRELTATHTPRTCVFPLYRRKMNLNK